MAEPDFEKHREGGPRTGQSVLYDKNGNILEIDGEKVNPSPAPTKKPPSKARATENTGE